MAVTTNAMAAAGIQPKYLESGAWAIMCTQAVASNAASGTQYYLFNVSSGATIVDAYIRLSAALSTAATIFHLAVSITGDDFVSSCAATTITVSRATKGLPYVCTADTPIYLCLDGGAATAAGSVYVTVVGAATDNMS